MTEKAILDALFNFTAFVSLLLVIISTVSLGKQIADIEYQMTMHLNGIRRLESNINFRKHLGRLIVGFIFLSVTITAYMSMPIIYRTWIARIEFVSLLTYMFISSILDWIAEYKQLHILMNSNPHKGLAATRLYVHSANNDITVLISLGQILGHKYSKDEDVDITLFNTAAESLIEKMKGIQQELRKLDPAYKLEKQQRISGEL